MGQDDRADAEAWRLLLERRLATLPEIVRWADDAIERLDEPPLWLLDAAQSQRPGEALSALLAAEGTVDRAPVLAALARRLLDALDRDPERDSVVAHALYDLAFEWPGPGLDDRELVMLWDAIDLARDGVYGVVEEERGRLRRALERMAGR